MDANTLFDAFVAATNFKKIQQLFTQLCALLDIDPYDNFNVFRRLKTELKDWRAQKLWSLLEKRAEQKEYCNQKACECLSVLVIGAGPCGLRSAIESALLGAYVVLVEQRDCFSRNNVLHIWPFVINDLRNLGIKMFYPKFCRGSIDHISIRQLQIFLVKIALVLGVQIHDSVAFQRLIFPEVGEKEKVKGWRAEFDPPGHILSNYVFDVLIGADGKRNAVPGFPRREMRGKLAIGITANFVNQRTLAEEKVQEISGVAYIFNQQFFKDMKDATGVDLENIVYYKDETHYFVMCAKKQSLLDKGVIIEDNDDVSLLLSSDNINQERLCDYAVEAADFATHGKLPNLKYALNHSGSEDVAMFDFTSLYSAECSVRLVERHDQRLLMSIVGDSLHESFWPTGSGCARGFLGVFDTAWMLRSYGLNVQGLVVLLAERESVYRLLAQAKPDNLHKQINKYTIDPRTRYISLEMTVQPHDISHLIDTDNPRNVETNQALPLRASQTIDCVSVTYVKRYKLWRFCQQSLHAYHLAIVNFQDSWDDGRALAALLGKFRPDLIDYLSLCAADDPNATIRTVFAAVESEYKIRAPCESQLEWVELCIDSRVAYIDAVVEALKSDTQRMRETLMNVIRTNAISHKRKATRQVDVSHAKKTDSICPRSSNLLKSISSTTVLNEKEERTVIKFMKDKQRGISEEKIRDAFMEYNEDEQFSHPRTCKRLDKTAFTQIRSEPTKHWTRRPTVDKLNPERLYAVEKIVSGEIEKEKARKLYSNKQRLANILTRKMDKHDIDEMELKLEQTAMGLLFNKEQYRVLSSREEKIISTNAAAARRTVNEGFKHDDHKYKEIDEKLSKADMLLKKQNLAGINIVSRIRNQNGMTKTNGSKSINTGKPVPPIPPKKSLLTDRDAVLSQELQGSIPSSKQFLRPCSVPVIQSCYESVNARRQIICQLCLKVVYLAERMQVEGMFIHTKCFRCAFCDQPLRLGNCGQDRNLHVYNPRFFCMQHINLPVPEKIARIEKNDLRTFVKANDSTGLYTLNAVSEENKECSNHQVAIPVAQRTELNSPSVLLGKTLKKMRAQKEALGTLLKSSNKLLMPESTGIENCQQAILAKEKVDSLDICGTDCSIVNGVDSFSNKELFEENGNSLSSEFDDNDNDDEDNDDFIEDELVDLEMALREIFDKNMDDILSEAQIVKLLKILEERQRWNRIDHHKLPPQGIIKFNENLNETFEENWSKMALTASETSKTVKAMDNDSSNTLQEELLTASMEKKKKARLKSTLKIGEELGLCRTSMRHSLPSRTSKNVSRYSPHSLLDLKYEDEEGVEHTLESVHLSAVPNRKNSQKEDVVRSLPATPSFSRKIMRFLHSVDKSHRAVNCYEIANENDEDSDFHDVGTERQEVSPFVRFSNSQQLRMRRGSSSLVYRSTEDNIASEIKGDRILSRSASMPATSVTLDLASASKNSTSCESNSSSPHATINTAYEKSPGDKSSSSLVTRENIRRVQKLAEKIMKQKEHERIRAAQDMHRELEEINVRKSEVKSVAGDLERRLCGDAKNLWVLEQWLLYVQEMTELKQREEELKLRISEFELNEEYKTLQRDFKGLENVDLRTPGASNTQTEKLILKKILAITEKRNTVRKHLEEVKERALQYKAMEPATLIDTEGASYRNFKPVFI